MEKEEYQKTIEDMMKDFSAQITGLSEELKLTKEHNQKLVRECDFLRNQLNLRSKNRLELVKG